MALSPGTRLGYHDTIALIRAHIAPAVGLIKTRGLKHTMMLEHTMM